MNNNENKKKNEGLNNENHSLSVKPDHTFLLQQGFQLTKKPLFTFRMEKQKCIRGRKVLPYGSMSTSGNVRQCEKSKTENKSM